MSNSTKKVSVVDVGARPSTFREWETIKFHFHDFANLPTAKDQEVSSQTVSCLGCKWKLQLFPGGLEYSDDDKVGVFLEIVDGRIGIDFSISLFCPKKGTEVASYFDRRKLFHTFCASQGDCDFEDRETVLNSLNDGSLTVEVRMAPDDSMVGPEFVPPNNFHSSMDEIFLDEKTADILIEVNNERGDGDENEDRPIKKAKTSASSFHAHRLILQLRAPTLAALCESCNLENSLQITDTDPSVFLILLKYIYGKQISEEELEENARGVIDAADKFGIINLKIEAETEYVRSTTININNAMNNLLYADAKNCALLKEDVMDFIVENGEEVFDKLPLRDVPSTMFSELLAAVNRGRAANNDRQQRATELSQMRVRQLRKLCFEKGLPIDGSRETMISALKSIDK